MTSTSMHSPNSSTRRATCDQCLRPVKTCICQLACDIDNPVEVLILQHPLEQRQAKGTARLLQLCLRNSQIVVGEQFDDAQLKSLLGDTKQNLLLYPAGPEDLSLTPESLTNHHTQQLRLVVIDGTWRKSRKMLHLNPSLSQLPRLALEGLAPGEYHIRKAQASHQLSTLEATATALAMLESDTHRYLPLKTAFRAFINQQIAQMGSETFKKHYN